MSFKRPVFLIKKLRQRWRDHNSSPEVLQAGDTYIVEFPKSGITWLTVLLANSFVGKSMVDEEITFTSVRRFIPDIHASRAVAPRLSESGIGFYKSHAEFNRKYVTTIYLVRHPLGVMKSYYKYCSILDPNIISFEKFLTDQRYGLPAWQRHVGSWLFTPRDSAQRFLHLLRYEDLLADPVSSLKDLNLNFGWGLSSDIIIEAVRRSTRDKMKIQEDLYRRHNPTHKLEFVGTAKVDHDQKLLTMINDICSEELDKLGYSRE